MSLESEPSLSVGTQWDVMKDMTENLPILETILGKNLLGPILIDPKFTQLTHLLSFGSLFNRRLYF